VPPAAPAPAVPPAAPAPAAPAPAPAAPAVVKLEDAQRDLVLFAAQVKNRKEGNEDLIGSLGALAKNFFNLEGPGDPPAPLPDGVVDPAVLKAHAAAVKEHEAKVKEHPKVVRDYQDAAVDLMFKGLRAVVYDPKQSENLRNDVNLKAAQVLGDVLSSPLLAACRDPKEVEKVREKASSELRGILAGELEEPKQEYLVPVAVLEAAFGALGRINDIKSLEWLLENYAHTNNSPTMTERLKAAHKAMILFKPVPGKLRYAIVEKFITLYTSAEARAGSAAPSGGTPAQKSAAAAAKKFWDDVKTDTVAVVKYFATPQGGAAPLNAEGQEATTMKELNEWWSSHDKPNRAPWLDEKIVDKPAK
jgi:hypothetical protein